MTQGYRLLEADTGAVSRALIFFGFVIAAALSLSVLFAVLVINMFGVPAGNNDFMLMTVVIAACVASPMAEKAARTRSLLSPTALSGRPTMVKNGLPELIWT